MDNYRKIWGKAHGPIPKDDNGMTYDIHHINEEKTANHKNIKPKK